MIIALAFAVWSLLIALVALCSGAAVLLTIATLFGAIAIAIACLIVVVALRGSEWACEPEVRGAATPRSRTARAQFCIAPVSSAA